MPSEKKYTSDLRRLSALTEEDVERLAKEDSEIPPLTDEELRDAVAVSGTGRVKVPVSIRIDEEVLEFFRSGGPGYQTRMNAVLLSYARGELRPPTRFSA